MLVHIFTQVFSHISSFNLHTTLEMTRGYASHFTGEEMEMRREAATCSRHPAPEGRVWNCGYWLPPTSQGSSHLTTERASEMLINLPRSPCGKSPKPTSIPLHLMFSGFWPWPSPLCGAWQRCWEPRLHRAASLQPQQLDHRPEPPVLCSTQGLLPQHYQTAWLPLKLLKLVLIVIFCHFCVFMSLSFVEYIHSAF